MFLSEAASARVRPARQSAINAILMVTASANPEVCMAENKRTDEARRFLSDNHMSVLSTTRRDGGTQMSIVTAGLYGDGMAFTTTVDRAKYKNLRRHPRASLLVSKNDWWGYLVLEGEATVLAPDNTDADELRLALRDVYRAAADREHPDWDEYDRAMADEGRAAVIIVPEKVYGTAI